MSFPPKVLIQIVDASSVITWDFDVCKGDIVFNIFHSKRAPQPPKKDSLGAHSITSPGGNNVQLIDKVWQLGRDYSMVESPLICKEGESVQVRQPQPLWGQMEPRLPVLTAEWWLSAGLAACFWPAFQLLGAAGSRDGICVGSAGRGSVISPLVTEMDQQGTWGAHLKCTSRK